MATISHSEQTELQSLLFEGFNLRLYRESTERTL